MLCNVIIFTLKLAHNFYISPYTHRRLRSAKSHVKNAIPYMFHHLDNENIKKSNNDLE